MEVVVTAGNIQYDVHSSSQIVTTTCVILSCSKIQNGDIPVLAYPGCAGKWPLNECCCCCWR